MSLDPLSSAGSYSALNQARVRVEDARRLYERMKPLYDAGAISREEFDQAKSAYDMASSGLTDASHSVQLASPIQGVLTDVRVDAGDRVESGDTLAVVADLSELRLILDVSQNDVEEFEEGQVVVIGRDAAARSNAPAGRVARVGLSADAKTRLFRVEIALEADPELRPGTLRYAQVRTYRHDDAIAVPLASVLEDGGGRYVYVVSPDGAAERRNIVVGRSSEEFYEVVSGLSDRDRVVVWGQNRLKEGAKVRIVGQGDGAAADEGEAA
ncbi:MAG: efflux RND transporter periplasmic adaptor subunit [Deltaproteobacteria bacterium]|nr:efflux RND transporter periplasmic adaptor subunit [Deltaproteobacteria bacterium]